MSSVDVSLHLWGTDLDPDMITKALNIKPTRSQKAGDEHESVSSKTRIAKCGMWELTSSGNVSSNCLRDHLTWMVQRLGEAPVNPSALETVEETRIDIVIGGGDDETATVEFEVDSLIVNQIAVLRLPLHFTVY
jgi:hypothetical protein